MPRGKTNAEKELSGTKRKRGKPLETIRLDEIPKPESYLPKAAHDIYYRLMRHVQTTGQLDKIDSLFISAVTQDYFLLQKYSAELYKPRKGAIQKFANKTTNVSTEYVIVKQCMERIKNHNLQLGLHIRSRDSILAYRERKQKKKQESKLSKVLGGNK